MSSPDALSFLFGSGSRSSNSSKEFENISGQANNDIRAEYATEVPISPVARSNRGQASNNNPPFSGRRSQPPQPVQPNRSARGSGNGSGQARGIAANAGHRRTPRNPNMPITWWDNAGIKRITHQNQHVKPCPQIATRRGCNYAARREGNACFYDSTINTSPEDPENGRCRARRDDDPGPKEQLDFRTARRRYWIRGLHRFNQMPAQGRDKLANNRVIRDANYINREKGRTRAYYDAHPDLRNILPARNGAGGIIDGPTYPTQNVNSQSGVSGRRFSSSSANAQASPIQLDYQNNAQAPPMEFQPNLGSPLDVQLGEYAQNIGLLNSPENPQTPTESNVTAAATSPTQNSEEWTEADQNYINQRVYEQFGNVDTGDLSGFWWE